MTSFLQDLKNSIIGDVLQDEALRSYWTDESIFSIQPQVAVLPKTEEDVKTTIGIASHHNIPITARGAGSGIAGQSIGAGLILDFSKYMNRVIEVSNERCVVQPGVILQDLNTLLARKNKMFAPDPGSKSYCTIGGMIATNAAGPHALRYGSTRDHIDSMRVVLADGKKYSTKDFAKKYSSLVKEIQKSQKNIEAAQPKVEKNSSGYHLLGLASFAPSFEKLFTGSEGTLGLVVDATLKIVDLPKNIYFGVMSFSSVQEAIKQVPEVRDSHPSCLELLNDHILSVLKKTSSQMVLELSIKDANSALLIEWYEKPSLEVIKKLQFFSEDQTVIDQIWSERSKVSKYLHQEAETLNRKPLRCIEDACVPISTLPKYVDELLEILKRHDCEGAVFGHVGNGHLHVNPNIRTDTAKLRERIENLMDDFYELVGSVGGTISGEHGDGILRRRYAEKQWKSTWSLLETVKRTFDPKSILNPDKKVPTIYTPMPKIKY